MKIDNFLILDKNNKVRYQQRDIKNTFHQQGEEYILNALFKGSENLVTNGYYIGLDARPTLNRTDTLSNIIGEPLVQGNNYQRQNVSFLNWQIINPNTSATTTASPTLTPYYAKSGPVIFSSLNSGWNSVTNIFLATTIGSGGKLISSATLGTTVSVAIGESVVMEMSISLYDY